MTVRPLIAAALFAVLLLGAGCGGDRAIFTAETDEPYYREGQRLVKQGREAEALSAFLKVIEKRGEQASAESHLEAGLICLNHIKDPIEAIHHFRKYLELQPNAKQAPNVRGLIDTAKREFARTLPAHPLESQAIGMDQSDQVRQLQRDNDALHAELTAQQTAATTQWLRTSRTTTDAGEPPPPPARVSGYSGRPADDSVPVITPASAAPLTLRIAPLTPTQPAATPPRSTASLVTPTIGGAPAGNRASPNRPATLPATSGGKKYKVQRGEGLYAIARKLKLKPEDIAVANGDTVGGLNARLRPDMELKIP